MLEDHSGSSKHYGIISHSSDIPILALLGKKEPLISKVAKHLAGGLKGMAESNGKHNDKC